MAILVKAVLTAADVVSRQSSIGNWHRLQELP